MLVICFEQGIDLMKYAGEYDKAPPGALVRNRLPGAKRRSFEYRKSGSGKIRG